MCWGSLAVVLDISSDNMIATVDFGDGIARKVAIGISGEKISKGDIVMVHAGVVISKLDEEGVMEQVKLLEELLGEESKEATTIYEGIIALARAIRGSSRGGS